MLFSWPAPILTLVGVLYACFLVTEHTRLSVQRAWLWSLRCKLAKSFGVLNLNLAAIPADNSTDAGGAGFTMMVCAWALILVLSMLTFAYEGHYYISLHLTYVITGFAVCLCTNQPKFVLVNYARLNVLQNAALLWYFDSDIRSVIVRRSICIRTIATLIFFESLEECWLHLLFMAVILDTRFRNQEYEPNVSLLPLKMFFIAVVPMHALGISEMISKAVRNNMSNEAPTEMASRFLKGLSFLACIIFMNAMFASFVRSRVKEISLALGVLLITLSIVLNRFARRVDRFIAPNMLGFYKSLPINLFTPLAAISTCTLALWFAEYKVIALVCTTCGIVLILTQDKLYSEMQASILLFTGGLLVVGYQDMWFTSMVTFLLITSSFSCLVLTCTKEVIFAHMRQENEAESFLSHAIKQRYAGIGAALEHILLDKRAPALLQTALLECRLGHARCHASNLFRKLDQGEKRDSAKRWRGNLLHQVTSTTMASIIVTTQTRLQIPSNAYIEADWEIVDLVASDLARKGLVLQRVWLEKDNTQVRFQFNRPISRPGSILLRLIQELQGEICDNVIILRTAIEFDDSCSSARTREVFPPPFTPGCSRRRSQSIQKKDILANLKFALVDDNVLIRKNFERLMHNTLGVPLANLFTCGETLQDCNQFAQEICSREVDIAIFDQNLEYDNDDDSESVSIKGTELAAEAKHKGFTGCLVLHSSDANIMEICNDSVFHCAIEKTANSEALLHGICEAWRTFKNI